MTILPMLCHFNAVKSFTNRSWLSDTLHSRQLRSEQTESIVVIESDSLPDTLDRSEPVSHRIDRVVKALFADLKGLSIFFGGFKSLKKLLDSVGLTELAPLWFAAADTWGSQINEIKKITSIVETRKFFCDPHLFWKNLTEDRSCYGVAKAVSNFVLTVAIPVALTVSCLATRGLIADPRNIISTSATAVIAIGSGIQGLKGIVNLITEYPKLSGWKKLTKVTALSVQALLVSSANSTRIANALYPCVRAGLELIRTAVDIGTGFYKFANLCADNWKTPQPQAVQS